MQSVLKKILEMKKFLFNKIQKLQQQHTVLLNKNSELNRKNKDLKNSQTHGIANNTVTRLTLEKIRTNSEKNDEQQRDVIRNILDTRKELDEMCLVVDNILFDNMIMLS